jgi:hypothetical protein
MRVKVLRDRNDRILATVDPTPNPLVQVEPSVTEGEKLEEAMAPEHYEFDLQPFYKKLERTKAK